MVKKYPFILTILIVFNFLIHGQAQETSDASATGISRSFNPAISVNSLFYGMGSSKNEPLYSQTCLTQGLHYQEIELVCHHVHWSYLLDWLGIKAAGYVELRPGIPPTPRHKKEITDLMKRKNLKIVIISSWKDPTKAEEVAHVAEAKLLILPGEVNAMPGADSYIEWLDYMVRKLAYML